MSQAGQKDSGHPSPHRDRARVGSLLYGLIAGPAAWATSQIANATLGQAACFPATEPLVSPTFTNVHGVQTLLLIAALLVSASGATVAWRNWRATRGEQPGDPHALLSIGEGRSRFMAFAGLLTSLGFVIAGLFSIPAILFISAC